ncbi:MAG TPA: hypothetical protein VJ833_10115 [Rhodanobacteraceae bacterium]|nr:hypothetical protein [Rhodanobacteraceae bacterium]
MKRSKNNAGALEQLNDMSNSIGGRVLWKIGEIVIACMVTALAYNISNKMNAFATFTATQESADAKRDQNIALMQAQVEGMQKISDATVQSVQQIGNQVTHNADNISELQNENNERMLLGQGHGR